jgi:hypothetical protein
MLGAERVYHGLDGFCSLIAAGRRVANCDCDPVASLYEAWSASLVGVSITNEMVRGLVVVPYDAAWPDAFRTLASRVEAALGSLVVEVDHIGSTSVPGLAAKDCIDLQVRVDTLDEDSIISRFRRIGFRVRPESWNRVDIAAGSGRSWSSRRRPVSGQATCTSVRPPARRPDGTCCSVTSCEPTTRLVRPGATSSNTWH